MVNFKIKNHFFDLEIITSNILYMLKKLMLKMVGS